MKRMAVAFLAVAVLAGTAGAQTALPQAVAAADTHVSYVGRWDTSDPQAPKASWTYSLVRVKFKGTGINAKLKGGNGAWCQVAVDGKPTKAFEVKDGKELYELAADLPNAEHLVELIRRDEAGHGPVAIKGFQLPEGAVLLAPPPAADKRILIVGDSISCGCGNEADGKDNDWWGSLMAAKENGYMAYGPIAARNFGADVVVIAQSGKKLFPNNTIVEFYDRVGAEKSSPKADLKAWVPDVVVIDLGTNDFGDKKNPPKDPDWPDAYKAFIKTIRETAPKAHIFVASGPMGTAPEWTKMAKQVVADLEKDGDKNVSYLPFSNQEVPAGVGGAWHPNVKTDTKMAKELSEAITKAVGWKVVGSDPN